MKKPQLAVLWYQKRTLQKPSSYFPNSFRREILRSSSQVEQSASLCGRPISATAGRCSPLLQGVSGDGAGLRGRATGGRSRGHGIHLEVVKHQESGRGFGLGRETGLQPPAFIGYPWDSSLCLSMAILGFCPPVVGQRAPAPVLRPPVGHPGRRPRRRTRRACRRARPGGSRS